jgi:hypothetical protein
MIDGSQRRRTKQLLRIVLAALFAVDQAYGFLVVAPTRQTALLSFSSSTTRCYSFFDALNKAFANDQSLSKDKTKQQYDAPGEEYIEPSTEVLTETQQKWRERQMQTNAVTPASVIDKSFDLELYLSGVADKDPSNDLYGSRVNISNRDRATGLSLPKEPSATVTVTFLQDGTCQVSPSDFTSDSKGEWKLSDDGKMLRFSMETLGYTRTVETRGSISVVSWSKEEEKSIDTQTTYSIPPGMVYCDIGVAPSRQPGSLEVSGESGVMRVEQASGMFGIASRMVPCGKFVAKLKNP